MTPSDDDVKGARMFYGHGRPRGFHNAFYEKEYGRAVSALDHLHHREDPTGYGGSAGALDDVSHNPAVTECCCDCTSRYRV